MFKTVAEMRNMESRLTSEISPSPIFDLPLAISSLSFLPLLSRSMGEGKTFHRANAGCPRGEAAPVPVNLHLLPWPVTSGNRRHGSS